MIIPPRKGNAMSFSENKGLWLGLCAVIVLIAVLIWLLASGGPLNLVILFPDSGELKRDDPVIWHGYTVGRVVKVEPLVDNQVGVTIQLREDYAAQITEGTRFTLKRPALFGWMGVSAIEIETPSETGRRYTDGEKIQGASPPKPTLVEEGKKATLEYWQQLRDQADRLIEEYRQSPYSKEIEAAVAEIKALAEKGASQAKVSLEQFRTEHKDEIDRIREKLEEAREWMRKRGDELGAKKLQEEIDRLKK